MSFLGAGIPGGTPLLSLTGTQELTLCWYGPIPFLMPTKVIQTYGNLITKDKTSSSRSVYGVAEGETIVTLMGYFKGATKGFFKRLISKIRSIQLYMAEKEQKPATSPAVTNIYDLIQPIPSTLSMLGTAIAGALGAIGNFALSNINFPVITPLATESHMAIKSMVFTHAAEQRDTFTFIVNLEKTKPDSLSSMQDILTLGLSGLMMLTDVVGYVNTQTRISAQDPSNIVTSPTPTPLINEDPADESFENWDSSFEGALSAPGMNPDLDWQRLPTLNTIHSQSFAFTIGSSTYKITLQHVTRDVGYGDGKEWQLQCAILRPDNSKLFCAIVHEGRSYTIPGEIVIAFETLVIDQNSGKIKSTKLRVFGAQVP